jgi:hypothetical protein
VRSGIGFWCSPQFPRNNHGGLACQDNHEQCLYIYELLLNINFILITTRIF